MNTRLILYFKTINENIKNYKPQKHNVGYMYWLDTMTNKFETEKGIKYHDYGKQNNEFDIWLERKVSLKD